MLIDQIIQSSSKVTLLVGGGNSQVFKVENQNGETTVYKIINSYELPGELLFFQRLREAGLPFIKILDHRQIGTSGYYQMEFIEAANRTLSNIELAVEIARQLLKLHRLKGRGFGRTIQLDDGQYMGEYLSLYGFIEGRLKILENELINFNENSILESIQKLRSDYKSIFSDTTESSIVFGDASLSNTLIRPSGEEVLIDPGPTRFSIREWEFAYFERRYLSVNDKERQSIAESFKKTYLNEYPNIDMKKVAFFRVLIALGKLSWSFKKQPNGLVGSINQFKTSWKLYYS